MIYMRKELVDRRAPLVPADIPRLERVYVQRCKRRAYSDEEYEQAGAILTDLPWYDPLFQNCLIVGIKELDHLEKLDRHTHLYFSHSFKGQKGSRILLDAFSTSKSLLYDFEYFVNKERYIAFGYWAGIVGGILGLQHRLQDLGDLHSFKPEVGAIEGLQIAILGKGRCAKGVMKILNDRKMPYTVLGKEKGDLTRYDIVYNCIGLAEDCDEVWFDERTELRKRVILVDISCDSAKKNNPIRLYDAPTTWDRPFLRRGLVDIIAIDNLPSLLPKESSSSFSSLCTELLLDRTSLLWERCGEAFQCALRGL